MAPRAEREAQRDAVLAGALATLALSLLASPDLGFGDSGELSTAALVLGVAHPTGFAVDLLWLKLSSLVPLGHLALRMNVATAITAGASLGLIAAITGVLCVRIGVVDARLRRLGVLWALAGMCGFATFLMAARSVEVYALALLVVLTATWLSLLGARAGRACFALLGLAAGLHVTVALYVALIVVAQTALEERRVRRLLTGLPAFAAGALVVTYLPLASMRDPALDWGDPETLRGLFRHLSAERIRSAYALDMFGGVEDAPPALIAQLKPFLGHAIVMLIAVLLLARLKRGPSEPAASLRTRAALLGLTLLGLVDLAYATLVNPMGIVDRQVGHVAAACVAIVGGVSLAAVLLKLSSRRVLQRLALVVSCVVAIAQWTFGFEPEAEDGFVLSELYGSGGLITSLPPRALFLCTSDDACSASLFALHADRVRPDMDAVPAQHLWDATVLRRLEGVTLPSTQEPHERLAFAQAAVRALAEGSARGVGRPLALETYSIARAAGFAGSLAPLPRSAFATTGVTTVKGYDLAARFLGDRSEDRFHRGTPTGARARSLWSRAFEHFGALGLGDETLDAATFALRRATMFSPERAVSWTNFGVALERRGAYAAALHATQRAVLIGPSRPTAWVNLARLYRRLGDDISARAVLVRAEEAGVRDPRLSALAVELRAP
jgi:hypothetical protein